MAASKPTVWLSKTADLFYVPYLLFAGLNPGLDLIRQGYQAYPGIPTKVFITHQKNSKFESKLPTITSNNLSISALPLLKILTLAML